MSNLRLEPVYSNSDLKKKTFDYLRGQKYLKFKEIKKFINNEFLSDYPFGFIILDENKDISGFLGTMFSLRFNDKDSYIYCNLHTWIIDKKKRYLFFSEGKKILSPIFDYKASFFAKPVKGLIRLFKRYYKMESLNMKYRISFLLKPSNLSFKNRFEIIDEEEIVLKRLNHNDKKIYNDHKIMNCYKFLICSKEDKNKNIFVVAIKKRKKFVFNILELIYVSNAELFKNSWRGFTFDICKKYKILFCANNYLKSEDCYIPEKEKIIKDFNYQVVIKNLPYKFKFDTLYSEFVY